MRMKVSVMVAQKWLGKMHRLSFGNHLSQSENIGELIHTNVNGPMSTAFLGKSKYFVCFKDDFSKFRRIFFLIAKSEVCRVLEQFLNEIKVDGHIVKQSEFLHRIRLCALVMFVQTRNHLQQEQ